MIEKKVEFKNFDWSMNKIRKHKLIFNESNFFKEFVIIPFLNSFNVPLLEKKKTLYFMLYIN